MLRPFFPSLEETQKTTPRLEGNSYTRVCVCVRERERGREGAREISYQRKFDPSCSLKGAKTKNEGIGTKLKYATNSKIVRTLTSSTMT